MRSHQFFYEILPLALILSLNTPPSLSSSPPLFPSLPQLSLNPYPQHSLLSSMLLFGLLSDGGLLHDCTSDWSKVLFSVSLDCCCVLPVPTPPLSVVPDVGMMCGTELSGNVFCGPDFSIENSNQEKVHIVFKNNYLCA